MSRTTQKHLLSLIESLNNIVGAKQKQYTRVDGRNLPNGGTYFLSGAYGGYRLECMTEKGGAVDIFSTGFSTAGICYNEIRAYIRGIEAGIELQKNKKQAS